MHELAKEFPNKNYRELERYRDADRNEEAQQIYVKQENEELTESQQKQEELEPIRHGLSTDAQKNEEIRELKDKINKLKKEIKELKHAKPGK
jgi:small-conductance mechanosensitive channel